MKKFASYERKQRNGLLAPHELKDLEQTPCCLNSKILIQHIRQLIKDKEHFRSKMDGLNQKLRQNGKYKPK